MGLPARADYYEDKWPRLIVNGKPVTVDQAEQILVRTNGTYLHCNDHVWEREAYKIFGLPDIFSPEHDDKKTEPGGLRSLFEQEERGIAELGMLRLNYLENSRIATSYIGGTHGWCDWDGSIGCADYNIGKWPSCEEVTSDWKQIARAFPYLDLKCQVVSILHNGNHNPYPLPMGRVWGTWWVRDGEVEFNEDETTFMYPLGMPKEIKTGLTNEDIAMTLATGGHHLTLEALRTIVDRVRRTLPKPERLAIDG